MFEKLLFFANTFAKFASTEFRAIINALDSALQEESEVEFRVKLRKMEQLFSDAIVSLPNNSNKRAALMAAAAVVDNIRNGTVARLGPDGEPRMMRITLDEAKEQVNQVRNGLLTRIFKPEEEFEIDEVGKINEPDASRDELTFDMPGEEASWFQVASIEIAMEQLYKSSKYKSTLFKQAGIFV
jgi:hypothetical protein